jgi:hypothetical protein
MAHHCASGFARFRRAADLRRAGTVHARCGPRGRVVLTRLAWARNQPQRRPIMTRRAPIETRRGLRAADPPNTRMGNAMLRTRGEKRTIFATTFAVTTVSSTHHETSRMEDCCERTVDARKTPVANLGERQVRLPGDGIDKLLCGLSGGLYPLPVSEPTVPVVVQRLIQWMTGAYRCAVVRSRESTGVRPTLLTGRVGRPSTRTAGLKAADASAADFARGFLIFSTANTTCEGTIVCAAQGCKTTVQS